MTGINIAGVAVIPPVLIPLILTHFNGSVNLNSVAVVTQYPGEDPTSITTPTTSFTENPFLSPDGEWIVFSDPANGGLAVIQPDGSGHAVIFDSGDPSWPGAAPPYATWHPNSDTLIFAVPFFSSDIYTIDRTGGPATVLYTDPGAGGVANPQFNFDGTKISFTLAIGSTHGIWTMNDDGSGAAQLDTAPGTFMTADWPPEPWMRTQSRLTWNDGTGAAPVFKAMDDDGSNVTTLYSGTDWIAPSFQSCLPDDSAFITFSSATSGAGDEISLMATDGSGISAWATPSQNVSSTKVFVYFQRAYFDSGDDVLSFELDGTDERNEGSGTTDNLGLTG